MCRRPYADEGCAIEFLTKPLVDEFLLERSRKPSGTAESLEERSSLAPLRTDFDSLSNRERQVMTLVVKD